MIANKSINPIVFTIIFFEKGFSEGKIKLKTYKATAIKYNEGNHEVIEKRIIPAITIVARILRSLGFFAVSNILNIPPLIWNYFSIYLMSCVNKKKITIIGDISKMKKIIPFALAVPLVFSTFNINQVNAEEPATEIQEETSYTVYEPEISQYQNTETEEVFYFVHDNNGVVSETLPFAKIYTPSKVGPRVQIADGAVYTWKYVDTTYGSNVLSNTVSTWLAKAVVGGISATAVGKLTNVFWAGVAGSITGGANDSIPKYIGKNTWWKVKKYYDKDAYNLYVKYSISIYSDSARKKLISQYIEVHKGAR